MKLFNSILITLTLGTPAIAQTTNSYGQTITRNIGNSWLGAIARGSMHMDRITTVAGSDYKTQYVAQARVAIRFLGFTGTMAEATARASSHALNGTRSRTGTFNLELLGVDIITSTTHVSELVLPGANWTLNVFHPTPHVEIPIGPVDLMLRGNVAGVIGSNAHLLLPSSRTEVTLDSFSRMAATATASVGFGIPGFGVGVGVEGQIGTQRMSVDGGINYSTGLLGSATYMFTPIALYLFAYVEAAWLQWDVTLCHWSSGSYSHPIF